MTLPTKDYYRIDEFAAEWHCRIEDIFHHFLHGRIRLGYAMHNAVMHGLNAELQTIGIYFVSGVVTIPTYGVALWELGYDEPMEAGGFRVERDYPPRIADASFLNEAEFPALMAWAPGRDWDTPETDHSLIEAFMANDGGLVTIRRSDVVIHTVERARLDAERGSDAYRHEVDGGLMLLENKSVRDVYSTPYVAILNAAIAEFFSPRRDRDTKKPEVSEWVKRRMIEAGICPSNNMAEAIFTIIKPADHDPRKRRG